MLKQKQLSVSTFLVLVLGTSVVSCNHSEGLRSGLRKDASRSDKLVRKLDNVPRAFAIGKLKKLEIVPEVPEKEGTVIGIVTEDRSIVSMDEDVIKQFSRPVIQQHVDQYMPTYRDFQIAATDFLLFKDGVLLLAFSIVSGSDTAPRKVYIVPKMHGAYIVLPRQATTTSCKSESCPSNCDMEWSGNNFWCQCQSSGYDRHEGCSIEVRF